MIIIKQCKAADVESAAGIYEAARSFMKTNGNPDQWTDNYPSNEIIMRDIKSGSLYKVCDGNDILAVFYFSTEEEPTYRSIYGGEWKSDTPCGVIHRIAVSDKHHGRGIAAMCFDWCRERIPHLRIDTHRDNIPMQHALEKYGFCLCGTIFLANGSQRLAYELCS